MQQLKELPTNKLVELDSKILKNFVKPIIEFFENGNFKKIKFDKSRYVGARFKKLSIKKISKLNRNYRKDLTNLYDGLKEVVNWHIQNKRY